MDSVELLKPKRASKKQRAAALAPASPAETAVDRLLITGGKQGLGDYSKPEWHRYTEARIAVLDPSSGEVEMPVRYTAQRENRPERDPSLVFKAASLNGGGLVVADLTEVLVLDHNLEIEKIVSHPCFNDLHHAALIDGRLHVVSTGIDSLIVLDEKDEVAEVRHALGEDPWQSFDRTVDYRKVATTKPHRSHPNFVFTTEHGLWVTRFEQRDAVCLDDPELRIELEVGNPHDGLICGGAIWFTTTNGHLIEADLGSLEVKQRIDLNEIVGGDEPLGWCRGLHVEGDIAYVGFTHFRRTRFVKNVRWVKQQFNVSTHPISPPTRVTAFDLSQRRVVAEWELVDAGIDAIFSILPWS